VVPEGKRLFGIIRSSWEDNIEKNLMDEED
jgi:hypothetical protein